MRRRSCCRPSSPREPYEATNRWTEYGEGIFRLKDRKDADYLLAPTHEELFALLVKDLYSSYKDLPVTLFQIQDKYRDEARPRAGLLRGREFTMKDAYSFDVTDAGPRRAATRPCATRTSGSSRAWGSSTRSSRPTPARWAARSPRSSCTRSPSARTPTSAAPAGTRPTSRPTSPPVPDALPIDGQPEPVLLPAADTPTIQHARRPREPGRPARRHPVDRGRHAEERRARADAARRARASSSSSGCPVTATSTSSAPRWPSPRPRSKPPATTTSASTGAWSRATSARRCSVPTARSGIRYMRSPNPRVVDGTAVARRCEPTRPPGRRRARRQPRVRGRRRRRDLGDPRRRSHAGRLRLRSRSPAAWRSGTYSRLGRKFAEALGLKVQDENGKLAARHDGLLPASA